jgi:hypothetical protein
VKRNVTVPPGSSAILGGIFAALSSPEETPAGTARGRRLEERVTLRAWRLHRVDVDAVTVAVIEVPPPRDGDRICCLQHSYDASQAGRIYVRLQGQTRRRPPDVVRALEDRHAAAAVEAASRAATLHEHGNDLMTQQLALQL